jgi:hypothetical protein
VSIFDTYRVVYTSPSGIESGSPLMTRDAALAQFDETIAPGGAWTGQERLRVLSEKVWIESQASKEERRHG